MKTITLVILIGFIIVVGKVKSQYKILYNFNDTTGSLPQSDVAISGSVLYGTTTRGGTIDSGVVFSFDTNTKIYSDLHDFSAITGGTIPRFGSLLIIGNKLLGMTEAGGNNNSGVAYSIRTNGTGYQDILNLANFSSPYGSSPYGGLILSNNKLYGMTCYGGSVFNAFGVVFSIDTAGGGYEDIFNFTGSVNGKEPYGKVTIEGNKFYGMTSAGGIYGFGNIFSMDTNGTGYVDLLDFNNTNGKVPSGSLTLSGDKLYGMTNFGGLHYDGLIFSIDTDGADYKDLLDFDGANGQWPNGSLILFKGVLYGMTAEGGVHDSGCIFSIDTNGNNYRDLADLNYSTGFQPLGSLTLSGDMLFGMTEDGGANGDGVIFCFKDTAIKIEEAVNNIMASKFTVSICPNPNQGIFNLIVSGQLSVVSSNILDVYNVLGDKIYSVKLLNGVNHINLGNSSSGVYLYRIISADESIKAFGKFVVE